MKDTAMSSPLSRRYKATAPSNIALLKYWGKQAGQQQWPTNPSISLSLSTLQSTTYAEVLPTGSEHLVQFNGEMCTRNFPDTHKIFLHLDRIASIIGSSKKLRITTANSFPTACGIASSASGFAALTIAALAAYTEAPRLEALASSHGWTREALAALARLGSGSACRSLWGGIVTWLPGPSAQEQKVGQLYPSSYWDLCDTVVLVSHGKKPTSSSAAHEHAWSSPLFAPRLAGFAEKYAAFTAALAARSMTLLGPLIEQEALEMHAVMMTATPSTHFFSTATAELLRWVRSLRQREGLALYFTLDAGPNVHILGEYSQQLRLHRLLKTEQAEYSFLFDRLGEGPSLSLASQES
jgi:diphosphomevalonate decarboxylase